MQINISARHGHLSQRTQERISEKATKLRRFFERLTAINITADVKDETAVKVEIQVSAEHTDDFIATETSGSLMTAVEGTIHKLEQQIRRHKEKLIQAHRESSFKHQELPVDSKITDD